MFQTSPSFLNEITTEKERNMVSSYQALYTSFMIAFRKFGYEEYNPGICLYMFMCFPYLLLYVLFISHVYVLYDRYTFII
jgi:hypothetical protein